MIPDINSILGERLLNGDDSTIYRKGIAHLNKYILWDDVSEIYIGGSVVTVSGIIPGGEDRKLSIVGINKNHIDFSISSIFRMKTENKQQFSDIYSMIVQNVTDRQWASFINKISNGERYSFKKFDIAQDAFYFHKLFGGYDRKDVAYINGCSIREGYFHIHYQEPYRNLKTINVGLVFKIPNIHLAQSFINKNIDKFKIYTFKATQ